jgi:hypothetical protein
MKAALAVCILSLFAFKSCHAQQTRAQISASVTIVEAFGVTAGATVVAQANGGALDVTTPLAIRGSAPRVVQVVDADRPRPISAQLDPSCRPDASSCDVRARVPAGAKESPTLLTYMIATVN